MALPPALQALSIGPRTAANVLELYVDYLCPFSAKMLANFDAFGVPLLFGQHAAFHGDVRVVVRPVPQPWHASSVLLHETALSVARLCVPDEQRLADPVSNAFWIFSQALMKASPEWYEARARAKTADQVRDELAQLCGQVFASSGKDMLQLNGQPVEQAVRHWTRVSDEGNDGSMIVPEMKYCNGIHVTPTALWNGVVEPSISSSFTEQEWRAFFSERTPKSKA
ncbi:hypothetical protein MVES1_000626 [Malassezia vespertilionis]|uniref:uncharacterized protein n=1 Tax=Malassezia vespertilionis TaxID=2020962 RepID=UPI0024B18C11|nr:uncharacterized protein MVES1_000626 [Malassezia vespertilionis]WFD05297.1 hypothetical protein MVES1_000626 [Malassezia vespertilionis]